ncbi:MAG: HupE/UreJ family protein [Saprospiraceae bacterium]|nr:HupE/UreJ family protein [Saprospiraceae bacterium]
MKSTALFLILFAVNALLAHPSPNTLIFLDIKADGVAAELRLPVSELGTAIRPTAPRTADELMGSFKDSLRLYLQAHITPLSMDGQKWSVEVGDMQLENVSNTQERGTLQDIIVKLWLKPPTGANSRQFILNYDVVMHQVVTHSALVSIRQDWETGVVAEHPAEVGIIAVEPRNNQIFPLVISLESKGLWGGFWSMVGLGRKHISEGTDHLLFLLVLLLAAPLLVSGKKWGNFGGTRYAFMRLLKIITAFTIGHSLTLLAGAVGWLRLPSQPIEVLIAFSILISAIHAIRPIFPNRETFVAAGFGLIHGLAFANTLSDLDLNATAMTLSILGFNIGIELQQLLVVALTVPSLILLSQQPKIYDIVRIGSATLAALAASAWIIERISGNSNFFTEGVESLFAYGRWLILALAVLAFGTYFLNKKR